MTLAIIILLFYPIRTFIVTATSVPYWLYWATTTNTIILFLFMIVVFEVWLASFDNIKRLFIQYEYRLYLIPITLMLLTNLVIQFSSPTEGDIRDTARMGFLTSQGMIPYLDFIEIHNPFYDYSMAIIFLLFNGLMPLYVLHVISFLALVLSAFFIYKIGFALFENKRYSLLMVIFFLTFKNIIINYDIRFDVFAALFLILGLFYLIKANKYSHYMQSGFYMALSFLFVQKTILSIAGVLGIMLIIDKQMRIKIKKTGYFVAGLLFPLVAFYSFFILKIGVYGFKKYFALTFIYPYVRVWNFNTVNKLVSYFITNGFHILLILLGIFLFIKYYQSLKKFKITMLLIFLNIFIFLFFVLRGGRISPQDFMYFIPILTIPGTVGLIYISRSLSKNIQKYTLFFIIILLIIIPFLLTILNIIQPNDNHEISFYLDNFAGEKSNCNLLYNPLHQYYWFPSKEWWFDHGGKEFFSATGLPVEEMKLTDMFANEFKIICTGSFNNISKELFLEKGYIPYEYKNHVYDDMFIKIQ